MVLNQKYEKYVPQTLPTIPLPALLLVSFSFFQGYCRTTKTNINMYNILISFYCHL